MPTILNFDALTYDTVEISKRGQTWTLRDDVPTKTLLRAFGLMSVQERLQRAAQEAQAAHPDDLDAATAALQASYAALEQQAASHVGDIFRHTDPTTTDEQLLAVFSFEDLMGITQLFFTLRSKGLNPPHDATSAPSTAATAVTKSPSRSQRRATARRS